MRKILGCLVLAGFAGGLVAASDQRWIHVRVDDNDGAKGHVDIQVPIEMVSTLLPALSASGGHGGIHVDGKSVDLGELRGYWSALKAAKDGDYLTVRDADSNVRVSKRGGYFDLAVDDKGGKSRVRMKIPLPLLDAVLAGEGDTLDVSSLGTALAQAPMGELLTVDDEDSHVRIWIDREAAPTREDKP
jgi:hypothetical protein